MVICPTMPTLGDHFQGPLSRGWIFQERLFSRRILHFGTFENSWECHCGIACERMPFVVSVATRDYHDGRPPIHLHYHIRLEDNLGEASGDYALDSFTLLQEWYRAVNLFSTTQFTYKSDKLLAIASLAKTKYNQLRGQSDYFAGIWSIDFPAGLAWRNATAGSVDEPPVMPELTHQPGCNTLSIHDLTGRPEPHEAGYVAPSFSWASMEFPVLYNSKTRPPNHSCSSTIKNPELLEVNVPTRAGRFSQVLHGSVRVRGMKILYTDLLQLPEFDQRKNDFRALMLDIGLYNPDPRILPRSLTLFFLRMWQNGAGDSGDTEASHSRPTGDTFLTIGNKEYVIRGNRRAPSKWEALVLVPLGASDEEYRRVGYFVVAEDSDGMELSLVDASLHILDSSQPEVYTNRYFLGWEESELVLS